MPSVVADDWLTDTRVSYDTVAASNAAQIGAALAAEPFLRAALELLADMVHAAGGGPVAERGLRAHLGDAGKRLADRSDACHEFALDRREFDRPEIKPLERGPEFLCAAPVFSDLVGDVLNPVVVGTLPGVIGVPQMAASKKPRAWRGASKTMVREI
jgi:hypothetical protein